MPLRIAAMRALPSNTAGAVSVSGKLETLGSASAAPAFRLVERTNATPPCKKSATACPSRPLPSW